MFCTSGQQTPVINGHFGHSCFDCLTVIFSNLCTTVTCLVYCFFFRFIYLSFSYAAVLCFPDDLYCPPEDDIVSMETGMTPTPRRNDYSGTFFNPLEEHAVLL